MSVVVRAAVAAVLLLAGIGKVRRPTDFARTVLGYRLFGWPTARVVARVLPPAEIAVGVAVAFGLFAPVAEALAAALFGTFAAALAINLARGRRDIDCGCFGAGHRRGISWWHAVRACVLLALAALAGAVGPPGGDGTTATVGIVVAALVAGGAAATIRQLGTGAVAAAE